MQGEIIRFACMLLEEITIEDKIIAEAKDIAPAIALTALCLNLSYQLILRVNLEKTTWWRLVWPLLLTVFLVAAPWILYASPTHKGLLISLGPVFAAFTLAMAFIVQTSKEAKTKREKVFSVTAKGAAILLVTAGLFLLLIINENLGVWCAISISILTMIVCILLEIVVWNRKIIFAKNNGDKKQKEKIT